MVGTRRLSTKRRKKEFTQLDHVSQTLQTKLTWCSINMSRQVSLHGKQPPVAELSAHSPNTAA